MRRTRRAVALRTAAAGLAVACALAVAAATIGPSTQAAAAAARRTPLTSWLTAGFNVMRTGYNAHETTIGEANAHRIHELWSTRLGDVMIAQPVEATGVRVHGVRRALVYEGTQHGDFYAIRADDGRVVWHKKLGSVATQCHFMPDGVFGIGDAGVIKFTSPGAGVIYVVDGDGTLHALDLATGAEKRGWPVRHVFTRHEATYGGLTLFDGRLYATDAGHCDTETPYYGGVIEVDVARHTIVHRFFPAGPPSRGISGGGVWGYGGVSIDPSNRNVFVATGNAVKTPQNYRYSETVVELSQSLRVRSFVKPKLVGQDVDFGSTPVLFRPAGCPYKLVASENKDGALAVYSEGRKLGARHSQLLQLGKALKGDVAWDPVTNMLYVANRSPNTKFVRGLLAFKASPSCSLSLAWQRRVGRVPGTDLPPPTVANGVVYYGDGLGDTEYAYGAATGRELWHSSTIKGSVYAPATIVNGRLFVPAWDGKLYAFGLAVH